MRPAPPAPITPKISQQQVHDLTSADLRALVAKEYPDYTEREAMAFIAGAMTSAFFLGMPEDQISNFVSDWSQYEERMFVALMYAAAASKEIEFAKLFTPGIDATH